MKPLLRIVAIGLIGLQLSGCGGRLSGLVGKIDPAQRPATNDIPEAQPMNTDRARTLFLIVVAGLRDAGKPRAAIAYLQEYGKRYPDDPKALLLLADCLVDTHQAAEAVPIYAALVHSNQRARSEAGLGRVAASRADWKGAAFLFQQAATGDAANTVYLNDLGYAQIMVARYDQALATLHQASELAPDSATIRNNLILALHLSGRDPEARVLIDGTRPAAERAVGESLLTMDAAALHAAPAPQQVASVTSPPAAGAGR